MREVVIRTDGSCLNNGQPDARGGCAICVYDKGSNQMIYRRMFKPNVEGKITNNRCEAIAFNGALQFILENKEVKALILSDSKTTVDGIIGTAKRKSNRDLWEPIENTLPLVYDRILGIEHIPTEENNDADHLAFQAANALYINEKGEWLV